MEENKWYRFTQEGFLRYGITYKLGKKNGKTYIKFLRDAKEDK